MLTIHNLLQESYKTLAHLDTAILDTEVILAHVLNKPREYLLTHKEDKVSPEQEQQFNALIARRANHEPVAYLINQKEFYGRNFFVDQRVHIPRPATEDLIDYIKTKIPTNFSGTMADIGTGSGCIAITLSLEFPQAKIIATDISDDALEVAKYNIKQINRTDAHRDSGCPLSGRSIDLRKSNLLNALDKPVDIIVSNPPYGWSNDWSNDQEIKYQPKISYESGTDGLDAIKEIIKKLPDYLLPNGQAFIEYDPRQTETIKKLAIERGFKCEIKKDLAGWDRIIHLF